MRISIFGSAIGLVTIEAVTSAEERFARAPPYCGLRILWVIAGTLSSHERQALLGRYTSGVEQALAKAGLTSCPSLLTLEALKLYFICAREFADQTYVWSIPGHSVHLANDLGRK